MECRSSRLFSGCPRIILRWSLSSIPNVVIFFTLSCPRILLCWSLSSIPNVVRFYFGLPSNTAMLVLEFDSQRGEILLLFAEMEKKRDQLLRAPSSMGRYNSTRDDEGRKC